MQTIAFCEIDPYCRKVLAKHWPEVPIHHDVKQLDDSQYVGAVDVICGGYPCLELEDREQPGAGACRDHIG
jgi:DNA (cytosine-5)-methyltransferase 1